MNMWQHLCVGCSYERELSLAVERERSLDQARAQTELDWQRRLEETARQQASQHQALLLQLTSARDQVRGVAGERGRGR